MKAPSRLPNSRIGNGSTKKHLLVSLLLAVITFIIFFQVTQSEFVNFDDDVNLTNNKIVREGLTAKGMVWAFTTGYAGFWFPLTWLSHMVVVHFFGLAPGWHHLVNLLLHLVNTLLLFWFLSRMTKAFWPSAFVAALFALHPLHVESVAWVTQRKDVLSTFFWILTIGLYGSYAARPGLKRYLAVLLSFTLGLMAKPMLVSLPFVLLLLDYWPLSRLELKDPDLKLKATAPKKKNKKASAGSKIAVTPPAGRWSLIRPLLLEKIPFLILTVLSSIVAYWMQKDWGAVNSLESLTLSARIANAFISYQAYIIKMVWPFDLAVLYPHPGAWPLWQVLTSGLLLIALTFVAFRTAKTRPFGIVGWLWYLGTLVPVIGIVQVGGHSMADRYTYVPLIGLFIIIAMGVPEILKKWAFHKQALVALSILSLFCLSVLTWRQTGYWKNNITLYNHTLRVIDHSISANPTPPLSNQPSRARTLTEVERSIWTKVRIALIYNNRGYSYSSLGNYRRAIQDYDKAIELNPRYAEAYNNRGIAYGSLGNYRMAIQDYDKAIELRPGYAEAYFNRGIENDNLRNYQEAIRDYDKAIGLNPEHAAAYYNRGINHANFGNPRQALRDMTEAARLGQPSAQDLLKKQGLNW